MYGFEKGNIPASYERVTWEERFERCPNDYGPPQVSTTPEDWAKVGQDMQGEIGWQEEQDKERELLEDITNDSIN